MGVERIAVAILLLAVAALVVGALFTLVAESTLAVEMGVGTVVLLAGILLGIGRGIQTRVRSETPYW